MRHVILTTATGDTDTELIAAPAAGKAIAIYGFYFSSDGAQRIDIEHGTTLLHRQYVPANGGSIAAFNGKDGVGASVLWQAPANTAVTYTNTVAANTVIEAWYDAVTA